MKAINPGMISSYGVKEGFMSVPWFSSFWVLVGFDVVGLPAVAQRAMSYKDSKSLHSGIICGTVVSLVLSPCLYRRGEGYKETLRKGHSPVLGALKKLTSKHKAHPLS